MKTIYVHIGQFKTGTTAIQSALVECNKLLEERGYVYPFAEHTAHYNLANELLESQRFDPNSYTFSTLQSYLKKTSHNRIILSTEDFTHANLDQIKSLANYLNGYQVKIVVYLRRQDQILQSTWSQLVKSGRPLLPFNAWLDSYMHVASGQDTNKAIPRHRELSRISKRLNYEHFIANYAQVFGEENILIRAYERSSMNKNILADFLQLIGMEDTSWIPTMHTSNVSPSMKSLEFSRLLAIAYQGKVKRGPKNNQKIELYFLELQELLDNLGWNNERINLINQAQYDQVMAFYKEGNDAVARTYLGRDELFREPFVDRPITSFDVKNFEAEEIMEVTQELVVKSLQLITTSELNTLKHVINVKQKIKQLARLLPFKIKLSNNS